MKEIGSEFWKIDIDDKYHNNLEFLNIGKDYKLVMCGMTAIDYVLNDFDDEKKIVYMPNYCCESMVIPFIDNGYVVEYYNVDLINNQIDIDLNKNCSVFFGMTYFGYNSTNVDDYIEIFSKRGVVVIEDITHRIFSRKNHCKYSSYLIASLRKWFPIYTGGVAINLHHYFHNDLSDYFVDIQLVELKKKAMVLKRDYIDGKIKDKQKFLDLYKTANLLIEKYKNKLIDIESLKILESTNIEDMINKRINNVKLIENKLNNIIQLPCKYQMGDCPIFVPIIINNRDIKRKKLIDNNIYCPVHWPTFSESNNKIYDFELSLICDQRYRSNDINDYIDVLIKIINEVDNDEI